MTTEQMKLFVRGRDYWYQYVKLNGYSFSVRPAGLKKLSVNLDISQSELRKAIHAFLSA